MVKKTKKPEAEYTAKDIYVLQGLEPVRRRPAMYIGSTGPEGLHHLIWEVVGNSLTYQTPILVRRRGQIQIRKIGELINKYFGKESEFVEKSTKGETEILKKNFEIETLTFDPITLKLDYRRISSLIRHKVNSEVYRITLQNNRKIEITSHHSLFTLSNGEVIPIEGKEIKTGTPIIVPKNWPEPLKHIEEIDLIERLLRLPKKQTKKINLYNLSTLLETDKTLSWKIKGEIPQYIKSKNGNLRHRSNLWQDYLRYNYLPFNLIRKLTIEELKKIKNANPYLGNKRSDNWRIPFKLKVTKELIELLGIFTAEGTIARDRRGYYRIVFSFGSQEEVLINFCSKLIEKTFGLKPTLKYAHESARTLNINSSLIGLIFKEIIKTGQNCSNKKISDLIFNLNRDLRERYLIGYLAGDGYPTEFWTQHLIKNTIPSKIEGKKFTAVTKNEDLAITLSYLLSSLNKTYYIGKRRRKKGKRFIKINYKGKEKKREFKAGRFSYAIDFYWNTNSSYINYLPAREIISKVIWGWPHNFSLNFYGNGGVSQKKVLNLLERQKLILHQGSLNFINSDLGILRVRKIEKIKYSYPYVYDFSVPDGENFVAGFSPIIAHNSIDESIMGHCNEIKVTLLPGDKVKVEDNGRGIPVDIHPQTKKSALETVMTYLHKGAKFGGKVYASTGGLHGVGVAVVCAISKQTKAEVCRDGFRYSQEYSRGKPITKVKKIGKCKERGTTIIFEPDPEIFKEINFDSKKILNYLRRQAYLTKGVKIIFSDLRKDKKESYTFYFEGGIVSYLKYLTRRAVSRHPNIYFGSGERNGIIVESALLYTQEYEATEESFANNVFTAEGGTHLTGFRTALTKTLNDYAGKNGLLKKDDGNLSGEDIREGLTAVVSIKIKEPQFEGQTKRKLGNPEAKPAVESVISETLADFLERNPQDARAIIENCILTQKARKAAKAAKETVLRKGLLEGLALPGKLADCISRKPEESELYIVEGESAGGCLAGDTKVASVDGRNLTFKELVKETKQGKKNYCYTIKEDGKIGIGLIQNPRKTRKNTRIIKIILDNNEEIICTPDHLFMLGNGSYKKAEDLAAKDSLMPLYRKYSEIKNGFKIEGYEIVHERKNHKWIYTHLLADEYNLIHGIYSKEEGDVVHHRDFNKLNNNPDNLARMSKMEHLYYHGKIARQNLFREDVQEKIRRIHQSKEYREKIRTIMLRPEMRKTLSERAKKQWEDKEYKQYMIQKFLEFYKSNKKYREKNNRILNENQKKYWSNPENRARWAEKVREYFKKYPEKREELSSKAKKQWQDKELLKWRSQKTKEQWIPEFRVKRKNTYNQTYQEKAIKLMKEIFDKYGKLDKEKYNKERVRLNDKSLLRYDTILQRFFENNEEKLKESVFNYNHKVKKIIKLNRKIDVYDLEVRGTHNFALASGVFVHNSSRQARDRHFQAILPLRGKILNVEKARLDRILASKEIKSLIIAMGTAVAEDFNLEKIRYHRVIIMADSDVDGQHIRTLLLTLFYRYFKPVIEAGYLYIAQSPLYKIQAGKRVEYAYTEADKAEISDSLKKEKTVGISIQRYKGLGEMNPEQLWETTMNPENRVLLKVEIEDAKEADHIFDTLMGKEVLPRKKFIQTYAKKAKNLDI